MIKRFVRDAGRSQISFLVSIPSSASLSSLLSKSEISRPNNRAANRLSFYYSPLSFLFFLFLSRFYERSPRQQFPNRPRDFRAINRYTTLA